jgi:hypothetical protein
VRKEPPVGLRRPAWQLDIRIFTLAKASPKSLGNGISRNLSQLIPRVSSKPARFLWTESFENWQGGFFDGRQN